VWVIANHSRNLLLLTVPNKNKKLYILFSQTWGGEIIKPAIEQGRNRMPVSISTILRSHVLNGDFIKRFADWNTPNIKLIKRAPSWHGHAAIRFSPGVQNEQLI
jgi:hypothetical protein